MYVYRKIKASVILGFAWKRILMFTIYALVFVFVYHEVEHSLGYRLTFPFLPVSTIGIAVAFYVGFKNNQSYDRFWEARKIWGGIINTSRSWGNAVLSFVTLAHTNGQISEEELKQTHKRLIYRHMAWINALRLQLRKPTSFSINFEKTTGAKHYQGVPGGEDWKRDVDPFILDAEECTMVDQKVNTATQLIRVQGEDLKIQREKGTIEDFRHMELMALLTECYTLQGKCERIKKTPLPRQYSYFSSIFVWIFILLMPPALVGEFEKLGHSFIWASIPFYVLIAWIFHTMEIVGDNSEDPFENFINDVPMTALCRVIEIDLREMLDEDDIPPSVEAVDGVLM